MAKLLYKLARLTAKRRWLTVGCWVALLALAGLAFMVGRGQLSEGFDIPGLESSKTIERLAAELPQYSGTTGTVVLRTTDGQPFTEPQREQIEQTIASAVDLPDVAAVVDPFAMEQARLDQADQLATGRRLAQLAPDLAGGALQQIEAGERLLKLAEPIRLVSEDGSAALVMVSFTESRLELASASKRAAIDHFQDAGLDGVEVAASVEISQDVPKVLGVGEAIGLLLAALVLVVMFRALAPMAVPVIGAVTGVGVAVLASLACSSWLSMSSVTPLLAVMLGLAVGLDYSLFIVNRHRRQLLAGLPLDESIALAGGTSGTAVVFAGATVMVALAALNVTGIPFLGLMGTLGALAVALAVAVAVTLTPAILGLFGLRVLPRSQRTPLADAAATPPPTPAGWRPLRSTIQAVLAAGVLVVLAVPAASLHLGLPDGASEAPGSLAQRAYTITAEQFGPGINGLLLVTADLPPGLDDGARLAAQADIAETVAGRSGVEGVAPVAVSEDGALAAFQVIPSGGPNDSSTEQLVKDLRSLDPVAGAREGTKLGVAGQASINMDMSERLAAVVPVYLAVVVGLSLLILLLVFRSVLVPLIAAAGFILSFFATLGALVMVFQWGWGARLIGLETTGPVLNFLPTVLAGLLFGLAMDYQIFLATGMREAYVKGLDARAAVSRGLAAGRGVVLAAGLIMVAIFGGFVLGDSAIVKSVGLALAFGVVADAFVVRLLLMPALTSLLGRAAWWCPRWLDRILPQIDVEGTRLTPVGAGPAGGSPAPQQS
ncbi:MAG: MMPL family transporter [Bifidobacteriaceae bacterium]|nr:MMPL family transporter [Bifidobacteriaceae bacterium]